MLYNILIAPIEYILQIIFYACYNITNNVTCSLLGLSLMVSFLSLPLYNRADVYQTLERNKKRTMEQRVRQIRKAFRGEERFWILSAYYKEQDYKPVYVLRSSLSLLLQIPFFIAAYHLLTNLTAITDPLFQGPDQLLHFGNFHVNIYPIIMTVLNLASAVIYTRDFRWKEKWQTFILPVLFFIILYDSPAGLVVYWIFNNLFSLIKNIVYKFGLTKQAQKLCGVLAYLAGAYVFCVMVYAGCYYEELELAPEKNTMIAVALFLLYNMPLLILTFLKEKGILPHMPAVKNETDRMVFLKELVLFVFCGIYIFATVIAASPLEFLDSSIWEMVGIARYAVLLYLGLFFVWFNIIYYLLDKEKRKKFSAILSMLILVCLYDYFLWDNHNGILRTNLRFEQELSYAWQKILLSVLCLYALAAVLFLVFRFFGTWDKHVMALILVGLCVVSLFRFYTIEDALRKERVRIAAGTQREDTSGHMYRFSQNGQNVMVIMLDRAIGTLVPYIMEERPDLMEKLDGFTYYPNALSMGRYTNLGSPELFGGYEYTPAASEARPELSLKEKHLEALRVLPVLFAQNDYEVILNNLPYAGYVWGNDMSMFDGYDHMTAFNLEDEYGKEFSMGVMDKGYMGKSFVEYSFFKTAPFCFQYFIYNHINKVSRPDSEEDQALSATFYEAYCVLENLTEHTCIDTAEHGYYIEFDNNLTHEPTQLQMPDYTYDAAKEADNSAFYQPDSRTLNGRTMVFQREEQRNTYHVDMAALLRLGEWFDYLRQIGVYDNTRIIIASDHGQRLRQFEDLIVNDDLDVESVNCMLLYKDFNATGWHVSEEFMTNADVPTLAVQGIIEQPVNPFTGKLLNSDRKYEGAMEVTLSTNYMLSDGNVYDTSDAPWYSVHDNIFEKENWVKIRD